MKILGFTQESFQDWDAGLSSIVFTGGCNYKCPACHAKKLLEGTSEYNGEEILKQISRKKEFVKRIVICGGEPTLQQTLPFFLRRLKEKGLAIKLDTNGSNYIVLEELLREKLVDYVAMDVKGPPQIYASLTGKEFIDARDGYEKAIAVASQFPDYEFRTTVVPVIRDKEEISFMTPEEIGETAKLIYDCTGSREHKYFLQQFVPLKGELVDSRLEKFSETPLKLLEEGEKAARKYLPKCEIRGKNKSAQ